MNLIRIISITVIVTLDVTYASESTQTWVVFIVFLAFSGLFFAIFTVGLIFNIYLISKNETWYEKNALDLYIKGDYSQSEVFQEGPVYLYSNSKDRKHLNPYNLGTSQNWKEVFGNKPIDWLWPSNTSLSNGTTFTKNGDDENQISFDF